MKLNITIGCAACGFANTFKANYGFDCSNLVCPKCGNEDCLSITSVTESISKSFNKQNIQKRLRMIQNL